VNNFGTEIRKLRKEKKLTLRSLAERSNLSYSFIASLEKGRYNPFIGYIDRREELKVRVDKLISMTLGMVGRRIDNLNLKTNTAIIENIVYSGVYLRYQNILEEGIK